MEQVRHQQDGSRDAALQQLVERLTKRLARKAVEPAKEELEVLPPPHEIAQEKPLYPRKFVQIINSQQVYFIEVGPGEFRRADANADLKDLPDSNSKPEQEGRESTKKTLATARYDGYGERDRENAPRTTSSTV